MEKEYYEYLINRLLGIDTNRNDSSEQLKQVFIEYLYEEMRTNKFEQIDFSRPIRVKLDKNLSEVCSGRFKEDENMYYIEVNDIAVGGEFIYVAKNSRDIQQRGFDGLLYSWWKEGLIENY